VDICAALTIFGIMVKQSCHYLNLEPFFVASIVALRRYQTQLPRKLELIFLSTLVIYWQAFSTSNPIAKRDVEICELFASKIPNCRCGCISQMDPSLNPKNCFRKSAVVELPVRYLKLHLFSQLAVSSS
jgi:hypothetical protein